MEVSVGFTFVLFEMSVPLNDPFGLLFKTSKRDGWTLTLFEMLESWQVEMSIESFWVGSALTFLEMEDF